MRYLILLLLLFVNQAFAFDSSQAFNTITFSYIDNAYVSQQFMLSGTQQSNAQSFTLSVDAKDGGGRPTHTLDGACSTYCSQYDVAKIEIRAYNSSGAQVGYKLTSQNLMNWGSSSNPGWSNGPGDNLHDWTTLNATISASDITGGNFNDVVRLEVRLISLEGSYWAGNYGVQFRTPTLVEGSSTTNLLYNPEFGIAPNSVKAQGWATSYSSYANCGVTSGSSICVTNESGVTANMSDTTTGYDATGGTTSGQAGGYDGQLSTTSADTAADTGTYSSTPSGPTTTTTTGTSLGPTSTQAATKSAAGIRRDSYFDNGIYIDQVGSNNSISILQASGDNQIRGINQQRARMWGDNNTYDIRQGATTTVGINLIELMVDGNSNNLTLYQDRYDAGTEDGSASGDHILRINVDGNSNTVNTNQRSQANYDGHFGEINIIGNSNSVDLLQRSLVNETAFIDITGNSNVVNLLQENLDTFGGNKFADIKLTGDGHTVNLTQSGTGAHQATIDLTYGSAPSTLNLNQLGSTNQSYSFEQTCYTVGGCSATLTQQ